MAARSQLTFVEECAGVGGLGLGLKILFGARCRCLGYVERDSCAAAALVARMASAELDPAPVWDDIATFDSASLRGRVSGVLSGFPCQPWSTAGSRAGRRDDRWLWPALAKSIGDMDPGFVWLENVSGLISGGGLEFVLSGLAALGFDAEWDCFACSDLGGSQERERLFILGISDGERWWREFGTRGEGIWRPELEGASAALGGSDGVSEPGPCDHWAGWRIPAIGSSSTGAVVAGGGGEGLQGREFFGSCRDERNGSHAHGSAAQLCEVPIFPPPPWDLRSWESVLSAVPTVAPRISEPALLRVADGPAGRVDRLRLAGNGVVPVVAAAAFLTLARRFL